MQVLRLLAARRAVATAARPTAASEPPDSEADAEEEEGYDEGPFFDLDFFAASVRASSSSSSASESDDAFTDLDLVISLHRSRSASPSYDALFHAPPTLLKPCRASEPGAGLRLRALSFGGARNPAPSPYGGRHSFARSSGSARSLRLFMESPAPGDDDDAEEPQPAPRDVFRRYLTKISRRLRRGVARAEAGNRGLRRLRKSRSASASAAVAVTTTASRRDDSLAELQDGIASAIAHCKESHRRASVSDDGASPLLRSRSDPGPGKCQAPPVAHDLSKAAPPSPFSS